MNEQERADWLSRAIDDLIRGVEPGPPPNALDDRDIDGLLRAAGTRISGAREAARAGLQYEAIVWRQVIQRLDRRERPRPDDPAYSFPNSPTHSVPADDTQDADHELSDLAEIAEMRRRMAERLAGFAETHRDEVWDRIQSRLEGQDGEKDAPSSFRQRSQEPPKEPIERLIDGAGLGERALESDPEVAGLISTAGKRKNISRFATHLAGQRRDEIWRRVREGIVARKSQPNTSQLGRWAVAAAAAALVVAAVGPIPATGLAGHPAADAISYAGERLGVTETDAAPPRTAVNGVTGPVEMGASGVSELLGVEVVAPGSLPGFTLASALFYPEPITGEEGGAFVLTYESEQAGRSLVVFQELASGANLAAATGSTTAVSLADGTAAVFIDGSWTPAGDTLAWDGAGARTLVFERDGVRTTLRYNAADVTVSELIVLANHLS